MPSFLDHSSNNVVKLLVAADSGAGKTGALSSLVDAGYNLRVLDFDNGLSVLKGYVKDKAKLANVHYVELKDELTLSAGRIGIKKAASFSRAMEAMDGKEEHWGAPLGKIADWTDRDILVLDTLTSAGKAALNLVLQTNAAGFKQPELQHWGQAMDNIEKLIGILTSTVTPCHVIVNTHLMNVEGTPKLYPDALGSKLGPKIPRYFDNMIALSITGTERKFKTQKDGLLTCKTARPLQPEYPIATGLASIFEGLLRPAA